jgi:Tfp pilus assembly protein PilN
VNHFNYLAGKRRTASGSRPRGITIENRIRVPLAAFVAAVTLAASLSLVQLTRLHAAQERYDRASLRLIAGEPALRETAALREDILRGTRLIDSVAALRRTSLDRANELAWIGNRLPPHAWLRALRFENGAYTLEGTSDRTAAVGAAMLALRDGRTTLPQLVSLRDDGGSAPTRVHYTLRVETHP